MCIRRIIELSFLSNTWTITLTDAEQFMIHVLFVRWRLQRASMVEERCGLRGYSLGDIGVSHVANGARFFEVWCYLSLGRRGMNGGAVPYLLLCCKKSLYIRTW